ncbi:MAG: Gfo/Idh/MocA family oxidoreductase [Planctomycetaceae bacterium]|nr:Gfo/Idh/MocA family oxidoreductase [Planctomycetaceae bacterium]
MRLRTGLIGLGDLWHTRHAPALRALADRFEVRAVCDPVRHRADKAAADFGADAVDGYHALVEREDIDAVLVLAPQWFRELPILAACESGKAVYCAVGLELGTAEAEAIKRRVEESGIAFMAELPRRHAPATVRLKELIATRLGKPRLLFCHERTPAEPSTGTADPASIHPTFRHMIGQVDWCHYVADVRPTSVMGVMHYEGEGDGVEDYRMMSLDFSPRGKPGTGPTAQISCGRYIPADWHEAIAYRPLAALQVSCANGIAFVDLPTTLVWFDEAGRHQESLESERPLGEQLLTNFFRAVTSLVRRSGDLEDACLALEIVQAARRSHAEGRRVEL